MTPEWIQVFSDFALVITVILALWKFARMFTKTEAKADKANDRLDTLIKDKEVCFVGNKNSTAIEDHEVRLRDLEKFSSKTEEHVKQIRSDVADINTKITKVLTAVNK